MVDWYGKIRVKNRGVLMGKRDIHDNRLYIALVLTYALLAGISIYLPYGQINTGQESAAPSWQLALGSAGVVLLVYGAVAFAGANIAQKIGLTGIWERKVSNRDRFTMPALVGVILGASFIVLDLMFSQLNPLGPIPHPPFPTSIVASVCAAIGEELLYRLFFISFWVWIISSLLLKNRHQNLVYWVAAIFSALTFSASHFPATMYLYQVESVAQLPAALIIELFLLNGGLSLVAAYYLKKAGIIAAIGIHFWADIVWHVIWGLF